MYFIDHTIAFAIDAPIKASDIQKLDQNIDELDARVAAIEAVLPVVESSIDWANAGGISQGFLNDYADVTSASGNSVYTTVKTVRIYVPANANSLEYSGEVQGPNNPKFRVTHAGANGTDATGGASYTYGTGTVAVSSIAGWTTFNIQTWGGDSGNVNLRTASYRII